MAKPKNVLFFVVCMLFAFTLTAKAEEAVGRGLFVSLVQDPPALSTREGINKVIDFAKQSRVKIIFLQVYRANQAWFPSQVSLFISEAHAQGIQVHAWLNLLSLGNNQDAPLLKKYGVGILTRNLQAKKELADYKIDDQYFLEPADPTVREEVLKIVGAILTAYPQLDGVQFDYLRYPDKNPAYGYTQANVERFKKATGLEIIEEDSLVWKNWKRQQVTEFLELLVKQARLLRPGIRVSVTGCMPYGRAYDEAFQDWGFWLKQGLVDFVTIMSYSADPLEFERWITATKDKVGDFRKVNIGVAAYKLVRSPEAFNKEWSFCEKCGAGSCVVFHYGSLLENPALPEFLISDKKI